MNNLKVFGKFLDQPILISKLNKNMPTIMTLGAGMLLAKEAYDVFQNSKTNQNNKQESKKEFIKKAIVLYSAVFSALIAPKIAGKLFKRPPIELVKQIQEDNSKLINEFIGKQNLTGEIVEILNKAKEKSLSFGEIKKLVEVLKDDNGKKFIDNLIPNPQNISAKDIFSEIGYLSVYGAIPVVGGIVGGIGSDFITKEKNIKQKIPDKINEGIYQYLANIFMCNIGAGGALAILEKMNIKSKTARAVGMIGGIILTGVLGGSKIANLIAKKVISPLLNKDNKSELKERKPELLDLCLHTDDIATVSLLSGLKWIEPALPILYSVSGYKAGIGYRN